MNKAGRTRDELIQHRRLDAPKGMIFRAQPVGLTKRKRPMRQRVRKHVPFPGRDVEYRPSASSLPMSVSAAK